MEQPVEALVAAGADINIVGRHGETPIQVAAWRGNREILEILFSQGAVVNTYISAALGNIQEVESYLEQGGDPNARTGRTPPYGNTLLYFAAANNQIEVADLLIKYGADVNGECEQGFYPLIVASQFGFVEMVELLIDCGADVSVIIDFGNGALELAAENGHKEVVQILLERGLSLEGSAYGYENHIERKMWSGFYSYKE
ncbi:MAG: ankyrin repeat domain-containing protein [Microcoleus sp. PH2017_17_BER_D_A]|nr:ankyrin repeat domain-containing protein [Microcoleus sp. PH2017_17_BER_D_A]